MPNLSEKQKIIFALLIAITLISGVLAKDWLAATKTKVARSWENLADQIVILAAEESPYAVFFFPRYPQRLEYLVSELSQASEKLVAFNEILSQAAERCGCSNASSQCITGPQGGIIFKTGSSNPSLASFSQDLTKTSLQHKTFLTEGVVSPTDQPAIQPFEESLESEVQDSLNSIQNFRNQILNLERELEKLKPEVRGDLMNSVNELKNTLNELEGSLETASQIPANLLNDLQREMAELERRLLQITDIPKTILDPLKAEFNNIISQFRNFYKFWDKCRPVRSMGDPCRPIREGLDETASVVSEISEQVIVLRSILLKELEGGLERELQSLREEEGQELRQTLEELLTDSESIGNAGLENTQLASNCGARNCRPLCMLSSFRLKACVNFSLGKQEPINMKLKLGVALDNLQLSPVTISNINLPLPQYIDVPNLGNLVLTIPNQQVLVNSPDLSSQSFTIPQPQYSLPRSPSLKLPCPNFPSYSSHQCAGPEDVNDIVNSKMAGYFEEFERLSNECQALGPDPNSDCYKNEKARIEALYAPAIEACSKAVGCGDDKVCMAECVARFNECTSVCEGVLDCPCSQEDWTNTCKSGCDVDKLIKERGAKIENMTRNLCKRPECFDPGKLRLSTPNLSQNYTGQAGSCPGKIIGDYAASMLSCDSSGPTIPKIDLPNIILPDIRLPEFNIPPFIYIKLPSLIIEDLILPDLVLCNLDECKNFFPNLQFQLPSLNIPRINVPPVQGPGEPEIRFAEGINLPPIPYSLPQMPELNLLSLMVPELNLPDIPFPQPKLIFEPEIPVVDIAWALATFIINQFLPNLPDVSIMKCLEVWGSPPQLRLVFPDFYFTWPQLPPIPEIPYCKDIRGFCKKVKTELSELIAKVDKIESKVNEIFQKELQDKLDNQAQKLNKKIAEGMQKTMEFYSQKIKAEVERRLSLGEKLPYLIDLPREEKTISLDEELGIPDRVPINWPESLKKHTLTKPIEYKIPPIPLSKLSYTKEKTIKIPGFQRRTFQLSAGIDLRTECAMAPAAGNACPAEDIRINIGLIKNLQGKIYSTSQKIIDILE